MRKTRRKNPLIDGTSADNDGRKRDLNFVVTKFMSKGFDALTEEELAVSLINPNFNSMFKQKTGVDWIKKYQLKTIEKLKSFNFDLNFMSTSVSELCVFRESLSLN